MAMWRLDCGRFDIKNLEGRGPYAMPVSCYLLRHGSEYVLFDAGLRAELVGKPEVQSRQTLSLDSTIEDQLARIGVRPSDIGSLVVSHYHGDHHGQANSLPGARLIVGKADAEALKSEMEAGEAVPSLAPWLRGDRPMRQVDANHDVFGDGKVVVIPTPGHTNGHVSLLVHLQSASYLLSGDAVHLRSQYDERQASGNHVDKQQALRTIDYIRQIERTTGAKLIIGHERADVALLPQFPKAAE